MVEECYGSQPEELNDLLDMLNDHDRSQVHILSASEDDTYSSNSIKRFPQHVMGIDWSLVEKRNVHMIENHLDMASTLSRHVDALAHQADTAIVMWGDQGIPSVSLPARIVMESAGNVIEASFDVYIYLPVQNVVIEVYHEGRLTVADVPHQ